MVAAGLLDDLMDRVDAGALALSGEGGLLPELVKAVLGRGLAAELTGHLGYEKGGPAGRGSPISRNGHSAKTIATEAGDVTLAGAAGPGRDIRAAAGPERRPPRRRPR
ncbi:hypothetical protein GCM10027575_82120 [Phytohabitans suffuscus]